MMMSNGSKLSQNGEITEVSRKYVSANEVLANLDQGFAE
jgi:hypothetical protein